MENSMALAVFMYVSFFVVGFGLIFVYPLYKIHRLSRMYPRERPYHTPVRGRSRIKNILIAYSVVLLIELGAALPHIGKLVDDLSADLAHGRESTFWLKVLIYGSYFVLPLFFGLAFELYRNRSGSSNGHSSHS